MTTLWQENQYFYLYRNKKGWLKQDIAKILWWERKLREILKKQWYYVEKIYNINKMKKKWRQIFWSKNKLLKFTAYFKDELQKWNASRAMIERNAIWWVMKFIFDPVVYSIYSDLENGISFKDSIKNFPNIFNDVYQWVVEGFFGYKYDPIEWLEIIEGKIKEEQEYFNNFIKKTAPYLWAIVLWIAMSFVLDLQIYESLVWEYAQYWKYVPDFTSFYHSFIWWILKVIPLIAVLFISIFYYLKFSNNKAIKIFTSKFILWFPIIWKIYKRKIIYDFVNIYYLLKEAKTIIPKTILLITTNAVSNFYAKEIFLEIYESLREWKNVWDEMEEYDFFDNEEEIIKVFKSDLESELELNSTRKLEKKKLDNIINNSFTKIMITTMILAVILVLSLALAYLFPINQKAWLIKQQVNEQKQQYLNNKK